MSTSGRCGKLNYNYGDDSSQSQSSTGDGGEYTGIEGQSVKNNNIMCHRDKPDTGKFHSSYVGMNVCGSAYENGCVVDSTCATAAD